MFRLWIHWLIQQTLGWSLGHLQYVGGWEGRRCIVLVLKRKAFLHKVQTYLGAHTALYSRNNGVVPSGVKRQWREADHWPPFSTDIKNEWSYTAASPACLHGVYRNDYTLREDIAWVTGMNRLDRCICLSAGTSSGLHSRQRIFWSVRQLSASQEALTSCNL
jgi:hypothetical protein